MILTKRLDRFILAKFLQLFVGAFFVCQFVFMMQFTWRWINDLVGKGLTVDILAQFFWYMAITLVPQSLPLAVLLASLITFGNMGENLELLSMKAAGVSLLRVMMPIAFLLLPLTAVSFHFQNTVSPDAQKSLRTLLTSIKLSQPAVEIPEGVFYNGVKGVNLFVEQKNAVSGMLYKTIIYKTDQGFDKAQIIIADSARLEITADKMHLRLSLWSGEQFQDLTTAMAGSVSNSMTKPFDRESFAHKVVLIGFDSNFNRLNADELGAMPQAKNMAEIVHDVDSMNHWLDSTTIANFRDIMARQEPRGHLDKRDSLAVMRAFRRAPQSIDKIFAKAKPNQLQQARVQAGTQIQQMAAEQAWHAEMVKDQENYIRRHWVEWHTKLTLSLACLLFFFVGAPLGAIIRKGGLGMPTVISVGIFIVYYIINTSGMKMARDGNINMFLGMWVSTCILIPSGAYLTFMANRDSVVFNVDVYVAVFRKIFGLRSARNLFRKEVIITPPDYPAEMLRLAHIADAATAYLNQHKLGMPPNYFRVFFATPPSDGVADLANEMADCVACLANSSSYHVLQLLNKLPIVAPDSHLAPFRTVWQNQICGLLFPLGLLLWVRIWRFRFRLLRDLRAVAKVCQELRTQLDSEMHPKKTNLDDTGA